MSLAYSFTAKTCFVRSKVLTHPYFLRISLVKNEFNPESFFQKKPLLCGTDSERGCFSEHCNIKLFKSRVNRYPSALSILVMFTSDFVLLHLYKAYYSVTLSFECFLGHVLDNFKKKEDIYKVLFKKLSVVSFYFKIMVI